MQTDVSSAQTALTEFDGVIVAIRSERSVFEVTKAVEVSLQRLSDSRLMEHVAPGDREGLEAYVDQVSAPSKFSIFWEMGQDPAMRVAGIPIESKFYSVGNAVAAGLGAPVRVYVSQRDSEKHASTWIRSPPSSANFGHGTLRGPKLLDAEMVKVFDDANA